MWSEARIVRQRHAQRARLEATVFQQTIASAVWGKQASKSLTNTLKKMNEID